MEIIRNFLMGFYRVCFHKRTASDKIVIGAMALIANKTAPSLSVRAEIIEEEGIEVLQIQIPMSKAIIATSDGKILRRRLKPDGSPENVSMYSYEISGRLSSLSQLDYSAQILLGATMDDLDENERDRLRNIIKYAAEESAAIFMVL